MSESDKGRIYRQNVEKRYLIYDQIMYPTSPVKKYNRRRVKKPIENCPLETLQQEWT